MGVDTFDDLTRLPAPHRRRRRASRHRIGPLRTVAEALPHPILRGIRSGAIAGFAIVAALSLPVLLVLNVRTSPHADVEPSARVWAATQDSPAGARAAPAAPVVQAIAEATPARTGWSSPPDRMSLDPLPVLDDENGALSMAETSPRVAKPGRPARIPVTRAPSKNQ